jgi:hypothetical protein
MIISQPGQINSRKVVEKTLYSDLNEANNQEIANASKIIVCYKEVNFHHAKSEIEPVYVENSNAINLSKEGEDSQSRREVNNQLPLQLRNQTKKKHRTEFRNKNFKCVKCHFRSNRWINLSQHFKKVHWEVPFNRTQCVQVLDEEEATRTLAAYENNYSKNKIVCRPFKCGMC